MAHSKMKKFIQGLNADEAFRVLNGLINDNADLTEKAYNIAMEIVDGVDADAVADDVYYELNTLDVDVLYGSSGRTRYGYVEPHEKAWEMFEESLQPFIDEMSKNQKRAMNTAAKIHCIGIIKGLRMFDNESNSDFKDWVTDAPGEYIDSVVEEWKKGNPSDGDIVEVMEVVKGESVS